VDFSFSDEQRMSAEVARQVLTEHCTPTALRRLMASDLARDEQTWRELSQIGLMGVLMPEGAGGLGLSEVDFVLIAEACGYAALPGSFVEHAGVAGPLLAAASANQELARRAATGEATLVVAHAANPLVGDADIATAVLAEHEGEVHLLSAETLTLTRALSIDPLRRLFRIDWTPSTSTRIAERSAGAPLWKDAFDRGALFTAAQCIGLAQRTVDLSVEYAKSRKQFGKPIGSYQAVKHALASVQVKIEFARPVVYAAAAQFSRRDGISQALISHAKLVSSEAAEAGARAALQIHGAMGYSWEVDVHLFLKRALALECLWGTPASHRKRVTQRILTQPLGPEHTFTCEQSNA